MPPFTSIALRLYPLERAFWFVAVGCLVAIGVMAARWPKRRGQ